MWYLVLCLAALAYGNPIDNQIEYDLDPDLFINSSYIVAGQMAQRCEFPSIVSLQIRKNNKVFMCGGSIIDKNHILTAAHCVASGVTGVTVFYGATTTAQAFRTYGIKVRPHPQFYTTSRTSRYLRKVALPIMSYTECHGKWNHIGHEHICAGDWIPGGATPCQGDSGGPLYCPGPSGQVLAGIVSFGLKCEYGPALYTNVAYFRNWIDANRV
ncbi:chymotrypsin B-like [Argonauta hians]